MVRLAPEWRSQADLVEQPIRSLSKVRAGRQQVPDGFTYAGAPRISRAPRSGSSAPFLGAWADVALGTFVGTLTLLGLSTATERSPGRASVTLLVLLLCAFVLNLFVGLGRLLTRPNGCLWFIGISIGLVCVIAISAVFPLFGILVALALLAWRLETLGQRPDLELLLIALATWALVWLSVIAVIRWPVAMAISGAAIGAWASSATATGRYSNGRLLYSLIEAPAILIGIGVSVAGIFFAVGHATTGGAGRSMTTTGGSGRGAADALPPGGAGRSAADAAASGGPRLRDIPPPAGYRHVDGYVRSAPDGNPLNNLSTPGGPKAPPPGLHHVEGHLRSLPDSSTANNLSSPQVHGVTPSTAAEGLPNTVQASLAGAVAPASGALAGVPMVARLLPAHRAAQACSRYWWSASYGSLLLVRDVVEEIGGESNHLPRESRGQMEADPRKLAVLWAVVLLAPLFAYGIGVRLVA